MKTNLVTETLSHISFRALAVLLVVFLTLPVFSLLFASSPADLAAGVSHWLFWPALQLSVKTTMISLMLIIVTGSPLAWWLATSTSRMSRVVELFVHMPIVLPPAVMGVALLTAFGRFGFVGRGLDAVGVHLPFTTAAVVIAQVCVSAPFFVQAASNAFRKVDLDLILVARTLGASRLRAFLGVAVPISLPGLVAGAALAWARSLGEFGATLLFAGNLSGTTQTMPLAIYGALESDVSVAVALALVLAACAAILLLALRAVPAVIVKNRQVGAR